VKKFNQDVAKVVTGQDKGKKCSTKFSAAGILSGELEAKGIGRRLRKAWAVRK